MFDGDSLMKTVNDSKVGKAKVIIEKISKGDMANYKLPCIVMVGDESAGKSSVLENITKCPILPRGPITCTKCPVVIKMLSVEDKSNSSYSVTFRGITKSLKKRNQLINAVSEIMAGIKEDVTSDEIVVNIADVGITELTFYDLPGISNVHESKSVETMYQKYLKKNCIVVCVVPTKETTLANSCSLSLVKKYGKLSQTIIALTMLDKINSESEAMLLIDRILCSGGEFKELGGLAGCVGIINREYIDEKSLMDNNTVESEFIANGFTQETLPPKYSDQAKAITANLGIKNLIRVIDSLCGKFISSSWKPALLTQMKDKIAALEKNSSIVGDKLSRSIVVLAAMDSVKQATKIPGTMFQETEFKPILPSMESCNYIPNKREQSQQLANAFRSHISSLKSQIKDILPVVKNATIGEIHINYNRFVNMQKFVTSQLKAFAQALLEAFDTEDYIKLFITRNADADMTKIVARLNKSIRWEIQTPFNNFMQYTGIKLVNAEYNSPIEALTALSTTLKGSDAAATFNKNWIESRAQYIENNGTDVSKQHNIYKIFLSGTHNKVSLYEESDSTVIVRTRITDAIVVLTKQMADMEKTL